jgi:hypothetical protein
MQTPEEIRRHAEAFTIWREGRSVAWECTAEELSAATKLDADDVRAICAARRWPIQEDADDAPLTLAH